MVKEIEVKVKINSFDKIEEELKKLGCEFSDTIIQKDIVFFEKQKRQGERHVFRIRQQDDKCFLTLKISKIELDCVERELEIKNPEVMKDIIELLDFEEVVRINKKRRKCNYKNYEICIDEVENLGNFIEVEKMSSDDGDVIKQELVDFLISLGVDVSTRVLKGYDTLMIEKQNENF